MLRHRYVAVSASLAVIAGGGAVAATEAADAATGHAAGSTIVLKVAKVKISLSGGGSKTASVLVTPKGRPVYLLTGDRQSKPLCTSSSCLSFWPALTTTAKTPVGKGIKGKLTVWHHQHMSQLELNGHPLYKYSADFGNGSAAGEGIKSFGGTWYLLTSSGTAYTLKSSSGSGYTGYSTSPPSSGW